MAHLVDEPVQPHLNGMAEIEQIMPRRRGQPDPPVSAHRLAAKIAHLRRRIEPGERAGIDDRRDGDADGRRGVGQGAITSSVAV